MSPKQTDLRTRIGELEATVRGLTQELVDANERIRQLENSLDAEAGVEPKREIGVRSSGDEEGDGNSSGTGTKQMGGDAEADGETTSDLDDIIVA